MRMAKDRTQAMPEQIAIVLRAAALVADAKVDLIILQASAFAMEKGPGAEEAVVRAIAEKTGIPALTSTQAMVRGARALGLKRLVSISPSSPAMNAKEKAYLEAAGFEVLHAVGLNVEGGAGLAMTPANWLDIVTANARADADGYFLCGSNTTVVEAVGAIERATGKPVVASTQATLWMCLRQLGLKLGAPAVSAGLGRLFGIA
jgi:maleate isomerase